MVSWFQGRRLSVPERIAVHCSRQLATDATPERARHFELRSGHSPSADVGGVHDPERRHRVPREPLGEYHPEILISPDKPHVRPDHRIRTRERSATKLYFIGQGVSVTPARGAIERLPESTGPHDSRTPSNAAVRARECSSGLAGLGRSNVIQACRHSVGPHSIGHFQGPALGQGDPLPALGGRWERASTTASSKNQEGHERQVKGGPQHRHPSAHADSLSAPHFFGNVLTCSRQRSTHASSARFDSRPFGST